VARDFDLEEDFDPWIRNPHAQTILGFLWRDWALYVPPSSNTDDRWHTLRYVSVAAAAATRNNSNDKPFFWDHRERVSTPDGDWFHADTKYCCPDGSTKKDDATTTKTPLVILLHGLESSSESPVTTELARAFLTNGMDCVGLNFRGCSGEPNDTLRFYHLGFTDDLRHYLSLVRQRRPHSPVYLAGFSLGANAVLQCLGELGARAGDEFHIAGAAVLCAPLDQTRNTPVLAQPGLRRDVYSRSLLRNLKRRAQVARERFGDGDESTFDKFDYGRAMAATTITEFDDAFTAQIYGFDGVWDYYEKTSSIHSLDHIAVPTLILNAADDPFFDPTVWPVDKSCDNNQKVGSAPPVKLLRSDFGGHLGFCFHQVADPDDDRLVRQQHNHKTAPPSWAALQLARFVSHVERDPRTERLRRERDERAFYERTSIFRFANFRQESSE